MILINITIPPMPHRPSLSDLNGFVPASTKRVLTSATLGERAWVGPDQAAKLSDNERKAYEAAHIIMAHLCVRAPTAHSSGHPGGPLSSFTFAYFLSKRRDSSIDQPLRISAGHLSLLSYGLQFLFGRNGTDERLKNPHAIIEHFRIPSGLPGHVEAGIGDIPFGTGPLGKGVSHGVGTAFGLKYQKQAGKVDVLLADGDSQEGQVMEAFRVASHLKLDNLVVHGDWNDVQLSDLPSQTAATDMASMAHACGWNVIEVQDGNDPAQVQAAQNLADSWSGNEHPTFICYYTTMGKGVSFMEEGSNSGTKNYHGAPLSADEHAKALAELADFDEAIKTYETFRAEEEKRYTSAKPVQTDIPLDWRLPKDFKRTTFTDRAAARKEFGATYIKEIMKHDKRVMVLHADLAGSGGFDKVQKEFPNRVINVGVAEANMAMMAAGMRQTGLLPITYTFAAFTTNEARANARLIDINCAHTRCGVIHDGTHAGLSVGEDGETHQEQNYLNIPFHHSQVWMPGDANQSGAMAEKALEIISEGHENVFIFSPRSDHPQIKTPAGEIMYGPDYVYDGKIDLVRGAGNMNDQITILATGSCIHAAIEAADELENVRVLNVSSIRPIDAAMVIQAALETVHLIVVEDHNSEGGLASQVADIIADFQLPCSLRRLGLNHYFPSGKAEDLLFFAGLDSESIVDAIQDELKTEVTGGEDSFVSSLYMLMQHLGTSRFRDSAQSFVEKIIEEKEYLEMLRSFWKKRDIPTEKLPSNEELRKRLGASTHEMPEGML